MLGSLKLTDNYKFQMDPDMAAAIFAQRLLSKPPPAELGLEVRRRCSDPKFRYDQESPRLGAVRMIVARLALNDPDSRTTYPAYIRSLSALLTRQRKFRMYDWFRDPLDYPWALPHGYHEKGFKCDLLAAAIYTEKDEMVRQLVEEDDVLRYAADWRGLTVNAFKAAALRGDMSIITYLLDEADFEPRKARYVLRTKLFPTAYRYGSLVLAEQLLSSPGHSGWISQSSTAWLKNCITPNVESLKLVQPYLEVHWREKSLHYLEANKDEEEDLCDLDARRRKADLGLLSNAAACHGWDDIASYLLEIDA
jgi:hypothetical protein